MNIHDEILAFIDENSTKPAKSETIKEELMSANNSTDKIQEILNYSKKQFFKIIDNRSKNGALWVYHDSDKTIHSVQFEKMGMKYKKGRGWWIK